MRQAINNLQSTWTGLGFVSPDNVFKVCDQPHPITIRAMLNACYKGEIDKAMEKLDEVWNLGYASVDIVTTIFRVVKTMDSIPEAIKVRPSESMSYLLLTLPLSQLDFIKEIGFTHMRILEGVSTVIQLGGLMSRLCQMVSLPLSAKNVFLLFSFDLQRMDPKLFQVRSS
jgi:replication factor C subunit 2/4